MADPLSGNIDCPRCHLRVLEAGTQARARGYCDDCQRRLGLPEHGFHESRRPPRPCARCGHEELVRCVVPERPLGLLEAHVCRRCGFVDWYALDPESIPIGAAHATELVKVGTGTPYR